MGKGDDPNCSLAGLLTAGGAGMPAAVMIADPGQEARDAWALRVALQDAEARGDQAQVKLLSEQLAATEQLIGARVFRIPADQLPAIEKVVDKAGRGAQRTGNQPPVMRVADTVCEMFEMGAGIKVGRDMAYVLISGADAVPGDGWRFVGTLNHHVIDKQLTTVIRRMPAEGATDLSRFQEAASVCEHCNTRRRRNETFLVAGPDGEIRQVGRSCLKDYIGTDTPEKAARYAELILGVVDDLDAADRRSRRWTYGRLPDPLAPTATRDITAGTVPGSGSEFGGDPSTIGRFDQQQYLAFVAAQARRDGRFITRREELEQGAASSATAALNGLFCALKGEPADLPGADDHQTATDALNWVREDLGGRPSADLSSFQSSLLYAARSEGVPYRKLPVLAAAINMYQREQQRNASAAASPSRHVGTLKEPHQARVTVKGKRYRDTEYGQQVIYHLEDAAGNQLTWFSTSRQEMDEGATYDLRGRVKRHGHYQGVEQTVLTNCRFSPADSAAEPAGV